MNQATTGFQDLRDVTGIGLLARVFTSPLPECRLDLIDVPILQLIHPILEQQGALGVAVVFLPIAVHHDIDSEADGGAVLIEIGRREQ
ncbi:MAG: hypothetical protein AAFQ38_15030 [Pseudomonadota bacterium]